MQKLNKIVIATHVYTTGPAQDLLEYLVEKKYEEVLFIGHPLFYDKKLKGSGYELYKKGLKQKEHFHNIKKIPEFISYLKDIILTIFWVKKMGSKWDMFIGSDNLNALSGIILRKFGIVNKVIYYVIDYNPKRFKNNILNKIYHKIDQFCVSHCDETWNLSAVMVRAREEYFGYTGGNQIEAPIGIWYDRIKRLPFEQIDPYTVVYMGHVMKKQGIQYIIQAIPEIIKQVPRFNLLVIGGGAYLPELKELASKLKVEKYIRFTGFIERHEDVEKKLVKCSIGVAFYEKYDEDGNLSFTHFSDPGKIKAYLASGLVVMTTPVPPISKNIVDSECGIVVELDESVIAKEIIDLMDQKIKMKKYRENAIVYASKYNWPNIFGALLKNK